jgi:hypothetical protein
MPRAPEAPKAIKDSKFFIDIKNELGLDYKRVRGDLLALSLSKPSNYYDLRTAVISLVTEDLVQEIYIRFWNLLRNGIVTGSDPITYFNVAGNEVPFVPQLPEHLINQFATKAARTVEDLCEEAVSLVLPDDYLQLSQNRQKDILRSRGMMEDTTITRVNDSA